MHAHACIHGYNWPVIHIYSSYAPIPPPIQDLRFDRPRYSTTLPPWSKPRGVTTIEATTSSLFCLIEPLLMSLTIITYKYGDHYHT